MAALAKVGQNRLVYFASSKKTSATSAGYSCDIEKCTNPRRPGWLEAQDRVCVRGDAGSPALKRGEVLMPEEWTVKIFGIADPNEGNKQPMPPCKRITKDNETQYGCVDVLQALRVKS